MCTYVRLLRSWSNHLNLEIMTSPWSLEEDMFIIEVGVAYTSIVVLLSSTCLSSESSRERAEVEGDRGPAAGTYG